MNKKIWITFFLYLTGHSAVVSGSPARLAVVNKTDGTASVFNLKTKTHEFTVIVGHFPHEAAVSLDGQKIFVSNYGKDHVRSTHPENNPGSSVSVIDIGAGKVSEEINLGDPACAPHGLITSSDGQKLYVTCEDREEIAIVDLITNEVIKRLSTGQKQSHVMVVDSRQERAYIANFSPGTVTVLDLTAGTILKQISTGPGTEGVALSGDGHTLYATSVLGNKLLKIDTVSLEIIQSVDTDRSPIRVAVTDDGKYVLVNSSAEGSFLVFDAVTLKLVKRIAVGRQPIGLSVAGSEFAFVANMKDNTVSVIDLKRLEVSDVISTGGKPDGLVYIPASE